MTQPHPEGHSPSQHERPGPGETQRFWGALLLALAVPVGIVGYVASYSPYAPSRMYRRVAGVEELGDLVAATFAVTVVILVLAGAGLLLWGARLARRRAGA